MQVHQLYGCGALDKAQTSRDFTGMRENAQLWGSQDGGTGQLSKFCPAGSFRKAVSLMFKMF